MTASTALAPDQSVAFGIGIYGNLSPQQSALNKPLPGISATQRSSLGQTYSDTELSLINTGRHRRHPAAALRRVASTSRSPPAATASSNTAANGTNTPA